LVRVQYPNAYRFVPIQFGWTFLSDGEKRFIAGIATATYTAKVQAGKSVIKITTSQGAVCAEVSDRSAAHY
jgi:hypothetical protein